MVESQGGGRTQEPSVDYNQEHDACVKHFDSWTEQEQVDFVQFLLSRMCHYQHGQINAFLKPMLQRDFISALPGKHNIFRFTFKLYSDNFQFVQIRK